MGGEGQAVHRTDRRAGRGEGRAERTEDTAGSRGPLTRKEKLCFEHRCDKLGCALQKGPATPWSQAVVRQQDLRRAAGGRGLLLDLEREDDGTNQGGPWGWGQGPKR